MILLIDTTKQYLGKSVASRLMEEGKTDFDLEEMQEKNISHCIGCNFCWLKTPGICSIRDDYEPLLRKMKDASQIWLLTDTSFGFVSVRTKNIIDRVMPLVTMYLEFRNGQMRHVMRYDNHADIGLVYTGDGDKAYLERWLGRVALNLKSRSLGVFEEEEKEEAVSCMC